MTSSILKAGGDYFRVPLGELAGDLGVCFSSSIAASSISLTISILVALFLIDCFLELATF